MKRLSLISSIIALLFTATTHAEIGSGFEAQVRLHAGETFVSGFLTHASQVGSVNAPYVPATPYGYVGYKLQSGLSFGLGLGFVYYNYNNNVPGILISNDGWALQVAPTLQVPFMHGDQYEFFGVARFILGAGREYFQAPSATTGGLAGAVYTSIPQMSYGGNLGIGGTWYPIACFGIGAEVGGGVNYLTGDLTTSTTIPTNNGLAANAVTTVAPRVVAAGNINAWYVQTYFSLNANYIF